MATTTKKDLIDRIADQTNQKRTMVKRTVQAFLDNANDLVQRVDPSGRILYVNTSWKLALGYTDEDLDRLNAELTKAGLPSVVVRDLLIAE